MTASILTAAGYRTGLFTSPYLETFEERFQINGRSVEKEALCLYISKVKAAADDLRNSGIQLTEFELVAAVGFLYFNAQHCDFVVLETGLGGRFDATNVIDAPIGAAITSISKDHVRVLGDTLAQIAREKCGILKPGSCAVTTSHQEPEVLDAIQTECRSKGIPLAVLQNKIQGNPSFTLAGTCFSWEGGTYQIPLLGEHQIENALLSLQLIQFVREKGFPVSKEAERQGLSAVQWPGRLELFSKQPMVLLDTAHNPGGIETVCQALSQYFKDREVHTVMGMLGDKAFQTCIGQIAKKSRKFYAAAPPIPARAIPAAETAEIAKQYCNDVTCVDQLEDVLFEAVSQLDEHSMLLICGSIPLVGESRTILRRILL